MQHKGLLKLLGLDYQIEYKKGINNKVADALSRVERTTTLDHNTLNAVTELVPTWMQEMKESYIGDSWVQGELSKLQTDTNSSSPYSIVNGLLRYKGRLCVGSSGNWRERLLKELHGSNLGGHSGILGTYQRVKRSFYWPKLKEEVHDFVQQCDVCQLAKGEHTATPGLLQPLAIPEEAWRDISMDFITGLPKSEGKDVVLVVVDRLTKYAHFLSLSHPFTAAQVAQLFLTEVYRLHGLPASIVTDRDPLFTGIFWKELMKKLDVKLNFTTAYHPQSDGQTERVNQCLENYLRCMVYNRQRLWHKWLYLAEWWYNTNYHTAVKMTPFEALYGFIPPQLSLGTPPRSAVQAVDEQLQDRHKAARELKQHLLKAQERMKKFADRNRTERHFSKGDWVYLRMQPYRQLSVQGRNSRKLGLKYYGPFEILEKIGAVAYKLNLPPSSQVHPVFHVSQLKKRVGNMQTVSPLLPIVGPAGNVLELPEKILDRKLEKRGNEAIMKLLIKWTNHPEEDATWEDYDQRESLFPEFVLRDKDKFKGGRMSAYQSEQLSKRKGDVGDEFERVNRNSGGAGLTVQRGLVEETEALKLINGSHK